MIYHIQVEAFFADFYIENSEDFEDINYISSGAKYTNKIFSRINSIDIISGFNQMDF